MPKFTPEYLKTLVREVIERVGTPTKIALRVSEIIVNADLSGHSSHGVMRLPEYLAQIDQNQILPDQEPQVLHETEATALMDGCRGWGHYAVDRAMKLAVQKARETGIGAVSLIRCNHAGRMGEYVSAAASEGCIGILLAGIGGEGVGCSAPFLGRGRYLGTNPMAVAVPTEDGATFVLDFATTTIARGKIKVAQSRGETVPEGCLVNADGKPTTHPEDFFEGGALLHFGGHKGYALSLMTCLLGGLSGAFENERGRIGGVYVQAVNIAAFQPLEVYEKNVRRFLDVIKSAPPAHDNSEVLLPGEPEYLNYSASVKEGIELPGAVWSQITEAAAKKGVAITAGKSS